MPEKWKTFIHAVLAYTILQPFREELKKNHNLAIHIIIHDQAYTKAPTALPIFSQN